MGAGIKIQDPRSVLKFMLKLVSVMLVMAMNIGGYKYDGEVPLECIRATTRDCNKRYFKNIDILHCIYNVRVTRSDKMKF